MLRFDDLLAAQIVSKQLPAQRFKVIDQLAVLRSGESSKSLLLALMVEGVLSMEQARAVQEMVTHYKHGRGLGIFVELLVGSGVPRERVEAEVRKLGKRATPIQLGEALVYAWQLSSHQERQLRFQARVALDRDLQGQVRQHLAAAPNGTRLGRHMSSANFREAVAHLPAVPSAVFRRETARPSSAEASLIAAENLGDEDSTLSGPGFSIPDWVDTSAAKPALYGQYRVLGLIGRGGMATVYLAHSLDAMDRPVALKVLKKDAPPDSVGRFEREILANGLFEHPNALDLYGSGQAASGERYLALEFFDGRDLDEVLEAEKRFGPPRALRVVRAVADALHAAHLAGIVHRDVKPGNILLGRGPSEGVRLMDFGIASLTRRPDLSDDDFFRTTERTLLGTPRYIAPEMAAGEPVGPLADLYSLGLVLYELLSGEFPFSPEGNLAYLACHMTEPPQPLAEAAPGLSALPPELHALVERLLQKSPPQRPQSAREVVAAIDMILPMFSGSSSRRGRRG